jgi:antitoxin (DNA-binding transcriptional repressor) of toxin-antitoxin stability system
MAKADDPAARITTAQRAQQRRDQKLADVQEEIDSGRMTHRQLTPEEMEEHTGRREELQAQRRKRRF